MIRIAGVDDLQHILKIYAYAREFMKMTNNPLQWGCSYPDKKLLENDIRKEQLYVMEEKSIIYGVFVFALGIDPTYDYIEDGNWLNDKSYGTIHRIAGNGIKSGVFHECIDYCKQKIPNIRIDTHEDNIVMRHLIEKLDFVRCGIIYVEDGSKRIAYQLTE